MKIVSVNGVYKAIYRSGVYYAIAKSYTLTINPTPADATVTFDKGTISGNTCTVTEGSSVTVTVSKSGYATISTSVIMNENKTVNVTLQQGIQLWGYTSSDGQSTLNLFMFGSQDTNGYCAWYADKGGTITGITGTIGASGSKLVLSSSSSLTYTYDRKITVDGRDLYIYKSFDFLLYEAAVLSNATIGSSCIWSGLNEIKHPYSANSSTVKYNSSSTVANRDSSLDYVFTGE